MDELKIRQLEEKNNNVECSSDTTKFAKGEYNRRATLLKLQWIAERARKVERIKKELEAGSYNMDSHEIAKALLSFPKE